MLSRFFKKKTKPKASSKREKPSKSASASPSKEEGSTPSPFKPGKLITAEGWRRMMMRRVSKK